MQPLAYLPCGCIILKTYGLSKLYMRVVIMTDQTRQEDRLCPYGEETSGSLTLCPEGLCSHCQTRFDFQLRRSLSTPIQPFKLEISSPCWWRTSYQIPNHRKYTVS